MKGLSIKPLLFITICLSIVFLFTAPLFLPNRIENNIIQDPDLMNRPEWAGIITIWYVPYFETATGNQVGWLNDYIRSFEKKYPGVIIDLKVLNADRLALYFYQGEDMDFLPNIIAMNLYKQPIPKEMLVDLSSYFNDKELAGLYEPLVNSLCVDGKLLGIPWMLGSYALFVNDLFIEGLDLVKDKEIQAERESGYEQLDTVVRWRLKKDLEDATDLDFFGLTSYSSSHTRPLLSIICSNEGKINNRGLDLITSYLKDGLCSNELVSTSYQKAFSQFAIEKRVATLLGSSKVLYDLKGLEGDNKGIDYIILPLPRDKENGFYLDQIAAMGVLNGTSEEARPICVQFLKGLLETECQKKLSELGMFSVLKTLSLYEDDEEMSLLEGSLEDMGTGFFYKNRTNIDSVWEDLLNIFEDYLQ